MSINCSKFYPFSKIEHDKYLSKNKNVVIGFKALYKNHADVSEIPELSRIGCNQRSDNAIVEICYYCSPKNGFGLLFESKFTNGFWTIVKNYME